MESSGLLTPDRGADRFGLRETGTFCASGTILAQSGGFVLTDHSFSGTYFIDAGSPVAGHAILVSSGGELRSGAPVAGPCGTGPGEINCAPIEADANDGKHIDVHTTDVSDISADRTFYLLVY